jgi:hypothetical protein
MRGKEVSVSDAGWSAYLALPARLVAPEGSVVAVGGWLRGALDE